MACFCLDSLPSVAIPWKPPQIRLHHLFHYHVVIAFSKPPSPSVWVPLLATEGVSIQRPQWIHRQRKPTWQTWWDVRHLFDEISLGSSDWRPIGVRTLHRRFLLSCLSGFLDRLQATETKELFQFGGRWSSLSEVVGVERKVCRWQVKNDTLGIYSLA